MIQLRALAFNLLFFVWTTILCILALPTVLLPRRWSLGLARFWSRSVLQMLAVVVGLTYELRGLRNLPDGPAVYAAKHQSAWDTMSLLLHLPDPVYVMKRQLRRIPVYGWLAARAEMIFVDRLAGPRALRSMLAQARAAVAKGRSIIIFPEGTRTAPGERRPYHPGIAALYGHLSVPVVPVALNSGLYWGRRSFLKRPGRIIVEFLPPIAPGLPREAFMAELERRIETASLALQSEAAGGPRSGHALTAG